MAIKTVQAIINGSTTNLSLNSNTGFYEATVSAPNKTSYNNNSEHYYPVTIKATDSAGNSTTVNDKDANFGSVLKLRVKETTAPAIVITAPTEDQYLANSNPTVTWNVTDSGSGVNPGTIGITIDSGNKITSGITKTAITNGYSCSYKIPNALSDGSHIVKIDASDYDGNNATQRVVNFTVDITPPVLSVSAPTNNLITNNSSVTVKGTTNDNVTGITQVTVKLNNNTASKVTVASDGSFSKALTLVEGANSITIVAKNSAGLTTTVTRIVTLDTKAPIINSIELSPNPVSTGDLLTVTVNVTD